MYLNSNFNYKETIIVKEDYEKYKYLIYLLIDIDYYDKEHGMYSTEDVPLNSDTL